MSAVSPKLPTIGEIARRTGQPLHRVEYLIRARGIKPVGCAGNVRVFAESVVERIVSELRRIDEETVRRWWTTDPASNLAIATEGLIVIDIDDVACGWYSARRDALAAAAGAIATTPRGGRHSYMRAPDCHQVRSSAGRLAPSVDVRGGGGYVVVAPSCTEAGQYAWEAGTGLCVRPFKLPIAPNWLLAELTAPSSATTRHAPPRLGKGNASSGRIPEGERNDRLTRIAGSLRRQSLGGEDLLGQLLEVNRLQCDPPLPDAEVERIARSVERYPAGRGANHVCAVTSGLNRSSLIKKTRIMLGADEHRVVDEAVAALSSDPDIYTRGTVLVRAVRTPAGPGRMAGVSLVRLATATLRERLTAVCDFVKVGPDGEEKDAHPPGWLVQAVEARGVWPGIRPVAGVADAPFIRPDGSICQTSGYDPATGVVLVAAGEFPSAPESPSQDDAARAVLDLEEVVSDFKFEAPEHRSAWIALALTVAGRFAFEGPSPMFAIDANIRGAGKGLLAQAASIISTGEETPVSTYPSDQDELRKQITTAAISGDRIILLDNIEGRLGDGTLDRVLTCATWRDRLLGSSDQVKLPMTAVWVATGNNMQIGADTARRIVHVRLDVLSEAPENRSDFRHPNLGSWIRQERARLHMACLTVLSAYILAGRPPSGMPPLGSFEGWSNLVRSACVWVGLPDPCLTRRQLVEHGDSVHEVLANVIEAWKVADPDHRGIVLAELAARLWSASDSAQPLAAADEELKRALEELCSGTRAPRARELGNKLRKFRRRVVKGWYLDTCKDEQTSAGKRWKLFPADAPG